MATLDLPQMSSYSASSAAYNPTDMFGNQWAPQPVLPAAKLVNLVAPAAALIQHPPKPEINLMANPTRRIVKVYVADTNDNLPLDKTLLYSGEEKLTDLTDQELFFEIDIKSILDKHNEYRTTVINKTVKDRTEYLEAAKVRDLRMTVVTVAQF